ncbi:bacterio-opsin activator domain-containing protein [Haloarcula sp. GH36]|uniref:bacterio-opsin activator domain-containing protein n=1 Tax=Haloarcula montana TaxID=3111776 RepID=UPI002D76CC5D|nr:bacterio-opsin activator domain-containing protein [Haloarcula sp. GH36]
MTRQETVLVVGGVDLTAHGLDLSTCRLRSVDGPEAALDAIESGGVDRLLVPYETGSISGAELAAVAARRAGVGSIVVGSDVPDHVEAVPGVEAVYTPAEDSPKRTGDLGAPRRASGYPDGPPSVEGSDDSLTERLRTVLSTGCDRLGLPYGYVTRHVDEAVEGVAAVGGQDVGTDPVAASGQPGPTDRVVANSDLDATDREDGATIADSGLACYVGTALDVDGDWHGALWFGDSTPREAEFGPRDRQFVRLAGRLVCAEISRHRQAVELRRGQSLLDRIEELAVIGAWEYDSREDTISWTDGTRRIYGVDDSFEPTRAFVEDAYDPADRDRVVERFERALETGESYDIETQIRAADGERKWVRVRGATASDRYLRGTIQDITERKAREHELETAARAIATAADAIYELDSEGYIEMVNEAVVEITGYDRAELLGAHVSKILPESDVERAEELIDEQLARDSPDVVTLNVRICRADGSTLPAQSRIALLVEDGELRGSVGVTRDISEQRAYERTLTELHDVSRTLLSAQSNQEISRAVADAADEILDIEAVGIYRFDEADNALRPEVVPETARDIVGDPPVFGPGEGLAWEVFVKGEPRVYDDVSQEPGVHDEATPIRSELLLPIGEYGVLLCGSTAVAVYDERTIELADLLVANAEAAYERMQREHRLRERDRELSEQNRRLRQVVDINDRIRRIGTSLVGATSFEEVSRIVCDGLVESDRFDLVWVGEFSTIDTAVTPQYEAGSKRGYLDVVGLDGGAAPEPTVRAATEREPVFLDRVANHLREEEWQREALSRDYRSVASLPLTYEGVPYGTLSVYSNEVDIFGSETQTVLTEFARTVAHTLSTVEQRRALLDDHAVELTLGLDSQPRVLFTLAATLGGRMELKRLRPTADGTVLYGTVTGVTPDRFEAVCAERRGIDRARVVGADGDTLRFELTLDGPCIGTLVADHGGVFDTLRIQEDHAVLSATFPTSAGISEFVRMFTDRYPSAELLARREREQQAVATEPVLSELTDRQREVLEVAKRAGFYSWPRESTAEEVAASMDISGPTFLEHLRRAEAKVVDSLLDRPVPSEER